MSATDGSESIPELNRRNIAATDEQGGGKKEGATPVWQITGWGETDFPEVKYANDLNGVLLAVAELTFGDPFCEQAKAEAAEICEGLTDESELPWTVNFEIGGIEIKKVYPPLDWYTKPPLTAEQAADLANDEAFTLSEALRLDGMEEAAKLLEALPTGRGNYGDIDLYVAAIRAEIKRREK